MVKQIDLINTDLKKPIYNLPCYVVDEVLNEKDEPMLPILSKVMKHIEGNNELPGEVLKEVLRLERNADINVLKDIFRNDLLKDNEQVKAYKGLRETVGLIVLIGLIIASFFTLKDIIGF